MTETPTTETTPRLCVLTGAGASKPLGLPTMVDLLPPGFDTALQAGERDVFDMVANWALATASDGILDFEVLFTGVDLLAKMKAADPVALAFTPPQKDASGRDRGGWLFKQAHPGSQIVGSLEHFQPGARALTERLKRVVHERLAPVEAEKAASLYYPLFDMLAEVVGARGVIDLFTTNYDRAVEASYEYEGNATPEVTFELVRGFRRTPRARTAHWNPTDYERSSTDGLTVKLYKLHGSLDWRRENGEVVEVAADEYVARNAVVYPLRKPSPDEPFRALLALFEQRIGSSQVCVVIGSSLRDEHIRGAIVKQLNTDAIHLVLVDPEIEKLRALLESEIGTERLNRLVRSAKVRLASRIPGRACVPNCLTPLVTRARRQDHQRRRPRREQKLRVWPGLFCRRRLVSPSRGKAVERK